METFHQLNGSANDRMKMQGDKLRSSRGRKILTWVSLLVIAGFYVSSAFGWFLATYMSATGSLGRQAAEFFQSLTPLDHVVRASQVILIMVACGLLLFFRRAARVPLMICLFISALATVFVGKWAITFLGGLTGLLILGLVTGYAHWLSRGHLLH